MITQWLPASANVGATRVSERPFPADSAAIIEGLPDPRKSPEFSGVSALTGVRVIPIVRPLFALQQTTSGSSIARAKNVTRGGPKTLIVSMIAEPDRAARS